MGEIVVGRVRGAIDSRKRMPMGIRAAVGRESEDSS